MSRMGFLRRHPVSLYFILAFGISWTGAFLLVAPRLFRGETIPKMDGLLMFPLMLLGPALAGIILTGREEGGAGLRVLFSRIGRWRTGVTWYAAALLIPPVMISVVLLLLSTLVSPIYTPNRFLIGFLFGIAAAFLRRLAGQVTLSQNFA